MADISFDEFFKLFNLDDMKAIFVSNDFISVRGLIEVTNEDLKDMGFLSLGKRKEFQAAIREIKEKRSQVEMDETTDVEKVSTDPESPSSLIKFDASIEIDNRTSTPLAKRKLDMNGNRLHDLHITVGPRIDSMSLCAHYTGPGKDGEHLVFQCKGWYIENCFVKMTITNVWDYLQLAEVKVFGYPTLG